MIRFMRRATFTATITFAASIATLLLVIAYTSVGRSFGQEWGSLDGPAPVWPAILGYAAMNLGALSGSVLAVLVLIFLGRELVRGWTAQGNSHR